jgi:serine/threonine protein kinase/Tol biopolymer transport system component
MITQQRWQQIKAIFHAAQQHAPEERVALLNQACGDDEALRQEVESLLATDESNEDFLATPAYELMAGVLADEKAALVAGQQIGPYTILSSLGEGGMGHVYLAQDARLPRNVALKLLSADVARDERRVQRFEHEAQAASRLNHPNVCMILEIGTAQDGRRFIAMEHIDGVTLRDRIRKRPLLPVEALDVGIQVAAALAAAHAADIVHRDIKPENIMLRFDGFIKVLDFGIAKLDESRSPQGKAIEATGRLNTEPGMLMGTVRYMSPEQLREAPVDQRTDIWSLGVVLYEMLTGVTPFEAPTANDTIALILGKHRTHFNFRDEVPLEFQTIIKKALVKDRSERYQTVKELAADLKKVRRRFRGEVEETPDGFTQQLKLEPGDRNSAAKWIDPNKATALLRLKSHAMSTADFLLSEIKEHKKTAVFAGVAAVLALVIIPSLRPVSKWINRVANTRQPTFVPAPQMDPLTNTGTSVCAAISADGKSVAHVEKQDGMQQLIITDIATKESSVVVAPDKVEYRGVTFSPDGHYLYFTNLRTEKSDTGTLYQVALAAGSPRKIKDWVDSPITFSPSGDYFAFVRSDLAAGDYALIIAGTDGTTERVVAKRGKGDRLSLDGPAWSPDGKTIVCAAGSWDRGYHMNLIEISVADAVEKMVGSQSWFSVAQVAWLRDGSGLIVNAREQPMGPSRLWRMLYPQGHAEEITTDPADYRGVSSSRDTDMIVSVQSQRITKIWTMANGDDRRAKAIAPVIGLAFGLDWTTSGKIVFSSMSPDHLNISLVDPDGANQTQLTLNAGDNYTPATSPDGRFIVFSSNRAGSFNIWRMNAEDGSNQKQLTFGEADSYPSCSADGKWVFYDNQSSSKITVWKVPIDGGDAVQVTNEYARMPVVSADNQFMACRYFVENGARRRIAIIPVQGGPPVKLLPIPIMLFQKVQWIANDHALSYIDNTNGVSNIWSYNLDDGSKHQLTNFHDDQIFTYARSRDNKQLAIERGTEINNVITVVNRQ